MSHHRDPTGCSSAANGSPAGDETIDVVNPTTEEVIGRIPAGGRGRRPRRRRRARRVRRLGGHPAAERAALSRRSPSGSASAATSWPRRSAPSSACRSASRA